MASARPPSGVRCSRCAFILSAGTVQSASLRATSFQRMPEGFTRARSRQNCEFEAGAGCCAFLSSKRGLETRQFGIGQRRVMLYRLHLGAVWQQVVEAPFPGAGFSPARKPETRAQSRMRSIRPLDPRCRFRFRGPDRLECVHHKRRIDCLDGEDRRKLGKQKPADFGAIGRRAWRFSSLRNAPRYRLRRIA